ncbi:MAG: CPBP family intramembrane metalloprotease [Betaproteobacteria bacterium]|nr:CPBP family intramembrane metalloprotease [Betaproteobacteria bacterium]
MPFFLKNIFEEFAWRSYLSPRLKALGLPALTGYALVAVVWFTWHVAAGS